MDEGTVSGALQQAYEDMISDDVGPFLRTRGFEISSDSNFKRERAGGLYDVIELQADWYNGTKSWHGFFVNVGIGSAEVDTACQGDERSRHPLKGSLLQRRWEHLVADLPYAVRFDRRTDMWQFTGALCEGFDLVLAGDGADKHHEAVGAIRGRQQLADRIREDLPIPGRSR